MIYQFVNQKTFNLPSRFVLATPHTSRCLSTIETHASEKLANP